MEIGYRPIKTMNPPYPSKSKHPYQVFILQTQFQWENSQRICFKKMCMFLTILYG